MVTPEQTSAYYMMMAAEQRLKVRLCIVAFSYTQDTLYFDYCLFGNFVTLNNYFSSSLVRKFKSCKIYTKCYL